jgi:aldose 1-epimerase
LPQRDRSGEQDVQQFEISSAGGLRAVITPFGARLVQLWVPDRDGVMADIVLGHDTVEEYVAHPTYFGATCGRYANRIAKGRFVLDGVAFQLDCNEGANHLHGGSEGFDRKTWDVVSSDSTQITMKAGSADGEMGYPGALEMTVVYRFAAERLIIEMKASTDAPTIINMVNHAYFNLAGQGNGNVLDHEMQVDARFYTPVDAELLTTGEVLAVAGTGFDFTEPRSLRAGIMGRAGLDLGYDHNWCLSAPAETPCVTLRDPASGRRLQLWTNEPGVQIYSAGQMAKEVPGKAGAQYRRFAGLTLETQRFPCSPNHAHFPSAVLRPGQSYDHRMEFAFDAE